MQRCPVDTNNTRNAVNVDFANGFNEAYKYKMQ